MVYLFQSNCFIFLLLSSTLHNLLQDASTGFFTNFKHVKLGFRICFTLSAGLLTILDIVSYIALFHHVWVHDNTIAVEILDKKIIVQRNKSNALSLMGCFATWIINIFYTTGLGLLYFVVKNSADVRNVTSFFKFYDFFLIPYVQILTSPPLRRFISAKTKK